MAGKKRNNNVTMTPREVASLTGIGVNHTYALLHAGEIPSIKAGKKFYIPRSALMRWLDECGREEGSGGK